MSAGLSEQRMKVSDGSKEQSENVGDELTESWRHQHQQQQQAPSYAPPISSGDPYNAAGYYGAAGTAPFTYQTFGVGDGTWSTNGADPVFALGGYAQPDTYGIEGVSGFGVTTPFSTASFGQPASTSFNYFHGNGEFPTWGPLGRAKQFEDYYRPEGLYATDGFKAVEAGVRGLSLGDGKMDKDLKRDPKDLAGAPKKTWATIASQPAKPQPATQNSGLKKKGPGMPPPPVVPGKHNMDIGTWDAEKNDAPVVKPQPVMIPQQKPQMMQPTIPQQQQQQQRPSAMPLQSIQGPPVSSRPPWTGGAPPRAPVPRLPSQPLLPPMPPVPPPSLQAAGSHPILDELRIKNNYNPIDFDLTAPDARFFVIKSYSEDDIHRSIKYEIWCSTEYGNKRLDAAYREREKEGGGCVYLFFSVNGSGHFCGMAQMISAVDYNSNSSVWSQDKWKGQFKVRWVYVKDVPNGQLRHIRLENNENKPVTNSRDTQEIPHPKGLEVLSIMHGYRHTTSIFDDFIHYEKRQEEEDSRKVPVNDHQAGYDNKQNYDKHESFGGNKGGYGGNGGGGNFNREQHMFNKEYNNYKNQGGYEKEHGNSGENYGNNSGGNYKGHRGDREHGNNYRDREQSGGGGGYRPHHGMQKERGEGSSRGRGRNRHN